MKITFKSRNSRPMTTISKPRGLKTKHSPQSAAVASDQQRLKLQKDLPCTELVLYTGTKFTEDSKLTIDFQQFKPNTTSDALSKLVESADQYGFIVMDGKGALFGTLSGNKRVVLNRFTVDLPKKHCRGGHSEARFARLRMEKRQNYLRKTAELATQLFIDASTNRPNITGLILAGIAEFKTELGQSNMFDPRLQAKLLKVVDVSYGGDHGFNEAIKLSSEILLNNKLLQESQLLVKYFKEMSQDTGKYVCGVEETMMALEKGAVETLIVWDELDIYRYHYKHSVSGETIIKHLHEEQEADESNSGDPTTGVELVIQEKILLLVWFANNHKNYSCTIKVVSKESPEGSQFCRGIGGIGGILRYQLDTGSLYETSDDDENEDSD